MIYRDFKGMKLSNLGMGCMRLPHAEGAVNDVDFAAVAEMAKYCIEHGVNYFDTAWGYHGGKSEVAIGEALSAFPRESFYLADKFPGYDLANFPKAREIFPEQLRRCKVEYFDFYFLHNVLELNIDSYLDPKFGIFDYFMEQKEAGLIKQLGFSDHGELPVLRRFLEVYGKDMEYCQLQLNFLDWEFQHGREKVELLREYGIPVWVMEPLRGGKLASLEPEHGARLRALRDESDAAWAFRFLQGIPEVKVILSGMSNMEQLVDNVRIFETDAPLTEEENAELAKIAAEMLSKKTQPCTGCRYCTEYCPQGIDIPRMIELYNEHVFTGGGWMAPFALRTVEEGKRPADCLHCRSCEQVCPQGLKISEIFEDFTAKLKG